MGPFWCQTRGTTASRKVRARLAVPGLLEVLQFLADRLRVEGQERSVAHHRRHAVAAQDVAQKLLHLGIDELARLAVDEDRAVARERMVAPPCILAGRLVVGPRVLL